MSDLFKKDDSICVTRNKSDGIGISEKSIYQLPDIYTIQYKNWILSLGQDDAMKLAESIRTMFGDQIHGSESISWHPNEDISLETKE